MTQTSRSVSDGFASVAEALCNVPGVTTGCSDTTKASTHSVLKVDSKTFAMISSAGNFVVKLPRGRVAELVDAGAGNTFEVANGLPMNEWLVIDGRPGQGWLSLARESLDFVKRS